MYRPSTSFVDRSNRAKQSMSQEDYQKEQPKKWCVKHPTSFWGETYPKCVQGFKLNQECEVGK